MYRRQERRRRESHPAYEVAIPRLVYLRRVPTRYRHMLPLHIMKAYQCLVVGGESGSLTVAITNRKNITLLKLLGELSGYTIFPVLIEPDQMHLLIRRMERWEYEKHRALNKMSAGYPLYLHSMLMFFTSYIQHDERLF
jgi:hypothetical protein